MQLVLLETAGNQRHVFGTNRLRENIGASEQIYRAGTEWLLEPLGLWADDTVTRSTSLLGQERLEEGGAVEVVYATSGKAVVLCDSVDRAAELIRRVTDRAVREAEGLDVAGCHVEVDWPRGSVQDAYRDATTLLGRVRGGLPPVLARAPQLPVLEVSAIDGLPARREVTRRGRRELVSAAAEHRHRHADKAIRRLQATLEPRDGAWHLFGGVDQLEDHLGDVSWLAVVHADGNGIGRVFRDVAGRLGLTGRFGPEANRAYVDALRALSIGLELLTEQAFQDALAAVAATSGQEALPVVPLILGGDDSTFVCDARISIELTQHFLTRWVELTCHPDRAERLERLPEGGRAVAGAVREASGGVGFGMAAGIAVVHAHHPFHAAYRLATQLTDSAKVTKHLPWPTGALDFHVLYDSSATDLDVIRSGRQAVGGTMPTRLWAGPYLVDDPGRVTSEGDGHDATAGWVRRHRLERLLGRREELAPDGGDRLARNALVHRLRDALLDSPERATAVLRTYLLAGHGPASEPSEDQSGTGPAPWWAALSEEATPGPEPVLVVDDTGHPAGDVAGISSLLDLIDLEVLR